MISPERSDKSRDHLVVVVHGQPALGNVTNGSRTHRPSVDHPQKSWFFKFKQRKVMALSESLVDKCVSSRPCLYESMGSKLVMVVNDCTCH